MTICLRKNLPVPEPLLKLVESQIPQETSSKKEKENTKNSTLKILAVMVKLYISKMNTPRLGNINHINVSKVVEDILQLLENNDINVYGLGKSSLNEKIAQALRLFERECIL